jgi:tRNA (cmo5U34)-methyltransferase
MAPGADAIIVEKSSVDQIRARFDQDVERFANLDTGQSATLEPRRVTPAP